MAGTPNQKLKTLFLLRILCERTDADHAMTLAQLAEELSRVGIESERKSLYRDLHAIADAGFAVGTLRSRDTRYYWAGAPLSRKDYLLLTNLLRISPAVPRKRKPELERKLRATAPVPCQRESFANLLSVISESSVTERVYSNVEILFDAILSGVKVRFSYKDGTLRGRSSRRSSRQHLVSPYRLVWSDGYYLVAADEYDVLTFYRVDRLEEIVLTDRACADIRAVGGDLDFDLNQYIKGCFASLEDPEHLIFRVSDAFLPAAERHFPSDSVIESAADGSWLLTCDVPADDNLFGWLLLHSEEIRLLYPQSLVNRLQELANGAKLVYGDQ